MIINCHSLNLQKIDTCIYCRSSDGYMCFMKYYIDILNYCDLKEFKELFIDFTNHQSQSRKDAIQNSLQPNKQILANKILL